MRVAVLGLGNMGSTHLRALAEIPEAQLAGVFSSDERKLSGDLTAVRGNTGSHGHFDFSGVRQYRDIDAALGDSAIEAVDICLPTYLHDQVAVDALRAGKHVLVEKPMALDLFGVDRMVNAARRYKRILMTAHVPRFQPEYRALREAVQRGQYGGPRFASFYRRCAVPDWGAWWHDPALCGGGVFDLLIHDADLCLHLFGKPKMVSACGYADPNSGMDSIDAQLFYDQGVVAIAGGWYAAPAYPFNTGFTVDLEAATIEYAAGGRPPTLYGRDGSAQALSLQEGDGYRAEIEYFLACCRSGQQPKFCLPTESADAVKLMLLMMESRTRKGARLVCHL